MTHQPFEKVRTWVFDLDNTLYSPAVRLFDQIEKKMTAYVMRVTGFAEIEADRLRKEYWHLHGTTLAGLMAEHRIDADAYLEEVHDISFEALTPDPHLAELIGNLPGRRIVYTNGSAPYAAQVLKARGLDAAFDAIYGVEHAGYRPKPEEAAFRAVFERDGVDPTIAAMFEDDPRNLAAPHAMGMRTIHVAPERGPGDHIEHHTDDLSAFLRDIARPAP
ncbi:pyrimidine 5'-nucleotidase [Salipiger pallidus]|uniref:Pyrimidine 5'-nucleotidase n=1 Tax=Salipiger pallidus TaxID=1775170 RepID=A0A8J2ZN46_9RHOB|nr:pyrimidine 5'-nucleotidase [Salipiger pallidus]GGG82759.1 pyrimidine 5'-nucleotidase [Salipiger pallidus]